MGAARGGNGTTHLREHTTSARAARRCTAAWAKGEAGVVCLRAPPLSDGMQTGAKDTS